MTTRNLAFFLLILALLGSAACQSEQSATEGNSSESVATNEAVAASRDRGMRARHTAPIPGAYADLTSPVAATDESLTRGEEVYETYCQRCHGETGMGEGPDGVGASPAPAPVAHTSTRMTDAYLFWRITEGGYEEPFNSIMIPWKGTLDETQRWDVINYMRALGSSMMPGRGMGGGSGAGQAFEVDPTLEAEQHAAMLEQAVAEGIITQAEANRFKNVHEAVDALRAVEVVRGPVDNVLAILVSRGEITQADADAFIDIHERLDAAGLMHE